MLCAACTEIFSGPRKLAYASIRPWQQTRESFEAALAAGCHLCHLIDEVRQHNHSKKSADFPARINYAFKPLRPQWARHGQGSKWYTYQDPGGDDFTELERYLAGVERDPTSIGLARLLADESDLLRYLSDFWIVLQFYGCEDIVLPMELRRDGDSDDLQLLADTHLEDELSTGHPRTLQLASSWFQRCLRDHPACGPRNSEKEEKWLPTRLLDVGTLESPTVRLVAGATLDASKSPYVALSHRWSPDNRYILRSALVAQYETQIPPSHLSDKLRDAAHVTRALGVRYLWVDCMCIIQDDGGRDFAREAGGMYKVYGMAVCTIAAAGSSHDGDATIFAQRDPRRVRPLVVRNPFCEKGTGSKYTFNIVSQYLSPIYEDCVRGSEWYNRGWVFQERMMSPRLLVFSRTQVLWGCHKLQAAETWPCGKTGKDYIDRFTSVEVEKGRLHALADPQLGIAVSHDSWWEFLGDYMGAELTLSSDRLNAIRGIATMVEDLTGQKYCGGFWVTPDLPGALLWTLGMEGHRVPKGAGYLAPSFSWAAVESRSEIRFHKSVAGESRLARILEGIKLDEGANTGRAVREALRVSGRLLPASILTSSEANAAHGVMTRAAGVKWRSIKRRALEYSKSLRGRIKSLAKKTNAILIRLIRLIVSSLKNCWYGGLMWVFIVLAIPLAIAALVIALALVVAAAGIALGLIPVAAILYGLFELLVVIDRVGYTLWTTQLYPRLFAARIRAEAEERVRARAEHEADMLRRQRVAEERAARVFADLEKGVRFEDPLAGQGTRRGGKADDDEDVLFSFYSDFKLPRSEVIDVFCLPLVRETGKMGAGDVYGGVRGLVLRLVEGTEDQYERMGVFGPSHDGIMQLPPGEEREFLLV
ncbi:heterokaryon incompatibility protein-domain-containing protein [Echria macrotheca]|uniref:Heterokaryon incompatibility protein-domain-containing protein n=1 Tax=Echria macrotheca TaxID=438768 RepID=A0AAJ0B6L5_9PEZI|nr:heterokaryon incompatibility protein-domain-containing protein [Echria macrotheca]